MKLTFVCIGNDEFEHIKILLPQLKELADEVIYVDCESKDGSFEYATSLGIRVLQKPRHMNANINRTAAFEVATGDWIFYADPDERFPKEIVNEIKIKISQNPDLKGFKLPRKNYFFGCWLKHGGQYPDHQIRIFKKGFGVFNNQHVHERLQVNGPIGSLEAAMEHYPYLTISQFIKKFDFYSTFEATYLLNSDVQINFKNNIKFFIAKPVSRFFRRYFIKRGFLDGIPGFFAALFDSLGWMTRYFKLWEIRKNK
ncbi:glycosyltransferase family 2 protein [bacterium]|nr:glycosyltransferase family 2 protein [bacterium]